ncbi:hypothetical protein KUCAC02_005599 [Chaenocephalus aceratus]|uniref:Uncharacterized protein n=1 Tax=Chaenocephalus aceratus TaxID=36190 RepID=A0ACB9WNW5_CHAAC|nr:hypothetical protein KUCAC02_005599 [Chaenocephalus aceratus]
MDTRVYQGVRVKHTVKDLLAEKRSRQTPGPRYNGGSPSPPSFVQMPGSHMLPSYYGMRRSFISDSDFCPSTKQFSPDVYSPSLGGKPLGCEPPHEQLLLLHRQLLSGDLRGLPQRCRLLRLRRLLPALLRPLIPAAALHWRVLTLISEGLMGAVCS